MIFEGDKAAVISDGITYLNPDRFDEAMQFAVRNSCRKICIYDYAGPPRFIDLSFLLKIPSLTHLRLMPNFASNSNIDALYALNNLTDLDWYDENIPIDISKLNNLIYLGCKESHNITLKGVETVSRMTISHAHDLSFFPELPSVKKLMLRNFGGNILTGLEGFCNIVDLSVKIAKKLDNILSIKNCTKLSSLELEGVSKNLDYTSLDGNSSIKELYLRSSIGSCEFISKMHALEYFLCTGVILDGDLDPIFKSKSLSKVYIRPYKKNYTPNKTDVETRFGSID